MADHALLYTVDGEVSQVAPENGTHFELRELYRLLKVKYIQVVPLSQSRWLVCDEEGKINGSLPNVKATTDVWRPNFGPSDVLFGNILVADAALLEDPDDC